MTLSAYTSLLSVAAGAALDLLVEPAKRLSLYGPAPKPPGESCERAGRGVLDYFSR